MQTEAITVGIADDHFMVRFGLRRLLASTPDLRFVGEATSAIEALELARLEQIDVLVLDLRMPGASTLEVLPQIRAVSPHTCVVILSAEPAETSSAACLAAGAHAYLEKPADVERLIQTIRAAAGSGQCGASDRS